MKSEYDMQTAITFLLIGVGAGAVLTLLCNPRGETIELYKPKQKERHEYAKATA